MCGLVEAVVCLCGVCEGVGVGGVGVRVLCVGGVGVRVLCVCVVLVRVWVWVGSG